MILIPHSQNRPGVLLLLFALAAAAVLPTRAQGVSTTTVQGTVYFANGAPGSGTLQLTWPAFTTAAGQAIASGRSAVTIGADGFLSVNLAPNVGATPAGLYYTAVYHLSDGSTSTEYRVVTAGDRNAGRGLTVQNLHCSELARWPGDPAEILAGLRAALAPGAETILESTPLGVGGCFYDEWRKAAETGLVRHFFPWWVEEGYRAAPVAEASLTDEERELRAREGLDLAQIGFRRQIRSSFSGLARQEYAEDAESCFLASGESVFELAAIDARLHDLPPAVETRRNGEIEIWLPPQRGRRYVVGVDPAGGGANGDYSAAQVVDMESGFQCAEFAGHLGGLELAEFVTALAAEYSQALLVIERNNHGSGLLSLAASVCRYPRIYRQGGQPGWLTTSISRPAALSRLNAALVETPNCFMSRRLLAECRSFVRRADGSSGAQAGTHDDLVMAMAIALAARAEAFEGQRDIGT